jgi:hypothetical protein
MDQNKKKIKDKSKNNDLQSTAQNTEDWATRTQLKSGGLRCSGWVGSFCSTSGTRCVNIVTNPVISHAWGM